MIVSELKATVASLYAEGVRKISWEQYWDNDESHISGVTVTYADGPGHEDYYGYDDLCFTAGARAIYAAGLQRDYLGNDPNRDYDEEAGGLWELDLATGVAVKRADCWMPEPELIVNELDEDKWVRANILEGVA